jgi:hypothetical protein
VPKRVLLPGLAVVFAVGLLLAGTIGAAGQTAETTTESATVATTPPARTLIGTTETVERTTTRVVRVPVTTTTATEENGTPAWVWVLLGILAVGLIVLIVLLARRGGGSVSVDDRRRVLDATAQSWFAQGWAIESQTADSVVLRRGADAMLVSVDKDGHVSTRPLPTG